MRALLIAGVLVVALPAAAGAKLRPYVPPGNSGANEYVESVPTAGGDNSTGSVITSGDTGTSLAPSIQTALTRSGPDGRATARVANSTAQRRPRHGEHPAAVAGGASGAGGGGSPGGAAPAGGVLRSLLGLEGQGGLGGALPAILIATVLALGAGRVWRRRTS